MRTASSVVEVDFSTGVTRGKTTTESFRRVLCGRLVDYGEKNDLAGVCSIGFIVFLPFITTAGALKLRPKT